jgi:alpha-tubulin suppressor-like RCC1 family protein
MDLSEDFTAVAGGFEHGLGLKVDGELVVWGNNAFGQCLVPEPNSGFQAFFGG